MSRSSLSLFAAAMAMFGMAVLTGHPPWGAVTGIAILLTAAAMAAGALAGKSSPEVLAAEQASRQDISAGLMTLSAAAIFAVYVAGYQRTRPAADQFETQTARHQSAAPPAAIAPPPTQIESTTAAPTPAQAPAPPKRKPAAAKPPAAATPETVPQPDSTASPATTEPATTPATTAVSYKDGTFMGWGRCRHGSIQASVTIEAGKIVSTEITECLTRYPCSWIAPLPRQVVSRQSAKVDYVSGATESTDAFYDAVSGALALATARE
jgi:uncharacterized protein with FMN-binding domain